MTLTGTDRRPPEVVVFDVNETLSDLAPMGRRFADVGAPELAAKWWFASLLRDGFALTAAGGFEQFSSLGEGTLRTVLSGLPLDRAMDAAVAHIMEGFTGLAVHPDVVEGVRALRAGGRRLVTLSNGSADVADRLLSGAGIRDEFEQLLSVESPQVWKPSPGAYRYAAGACDVPLERMMLVAVHPWDIDGAARAGMRTAWIDRTAAPYPAYFRKPEVTVAALPELAERLAPATD
jgi:2-haloacid dehalogenase